MKVKKTFTILINSIYMKLSLTYGHSNVAFRDELTYKGLRDGLWMQWLNHIFYYNDLITPCWCYRDTAKKKKAYLSKNFVGKIPLNVPTWWIKQLIINEAIVRSFVLTLIIIIIQILYISLLQKVKRTLYQFCVFCINISRAIILMCSSPWYIDFMN